MAPERDQRVKQLFQQAAALEANQRAAFLAEACADDVPLRQEIESLIEAYEQPTVGLKAPVVSYTTQHIEATGEVEPPSSDRLTLPETEAVSVSTIGQRIGPYQVMRELGHGGMGAVYLATRADDEYRKRVAIKLVRRGLASDFILRRFRQERQILASLDHPHIAKLLDGGTTEDGLPYFVMEYIEGQPITEYCDRHKLATSARLKLFREVCAAVQYAHQNLIIHRDLKPGNILVTADGTPKLLDFGIAKLLNPELAAEAIDPTMTAMRLMTPGYASPEQVRGEPISTASDVYSLGVVLYELLTGHHPYRFTSHLPHELIRIICEEEPSKPSTAVTRVEEVKSTDGSVALTPESVSKTRDTQPEKLRRRLAGDLDNIVLMAMRKESQRRYASVSQFSEDVRRHLEGLPVLARKDTFSYRAGKFIQRHKTGTAAAALVVLALLVGIVATTWEARIARAERARAEKRFNDVRQLANSFMFELHDAIEKLPGSTPARALLVTRALEYLDSLAAESRNDPSLARELATAYEKVGDIQGNPYSANLGDPSGALASYRKALSIREALAAATPKSLDARLDLTAILGKVGDMLGSSHDFAAALEHYRRALQISEALAAEDPTNAKVRRALSKSHEYLGSALEQSGDLAGSLTQYRQALQFSEALAAQEPNNLVAKRSIGVLLGKLSKLLAKTDAQAEGVRYARQSLQIFESLAALDPNDAKARRELAVSYNQLGDLLWATGDVEGELAHYRQALKIREEMAAADPTNMQLRRDLGVSYGNVGYAESQLNQADAAINHYRQAMTIFEALAAANPGNGLALRDLSAYYDYLGDVYAHLASSASVPARVKIERWQEARAWYGRSLKLTQEMRERGILRGADADMIEKLKGEIANCDDELKKLR